MLQLADVNINCRVLLRRQQETIVHQHIIVESLVVVNENLIADLNS